LEILTQNWLEHSTNTTDRDEDVAPNRGFSR